MVTAWILSICFVLAQADKQVMGLLATPVQAQFQLTNVELGLLQGAAFAIAYSVGGLPIARMLDAGRRIRIAAVCVALWSLATLGTGLASSFGALVLCRAATAFAEAGLPPAAFSVFAQRSEREAAKLISGFMLAPFVGGGLVLLVGGLILKAVPAGATLLPGWSQPWRLVLFAVGAPGLLLAILLWMVGREPPRALAASGVALPAMRSVLHSIFVGQPHLRYYYLGATCFYALVAALIGWYPTLLVREFSITTATAGGYAGIIFLVCGVAGTLAVNTLARLRASIDLARTIRDFTVVASLLAPVVVAMPLVGALKVSLGLYALYAFASAAIISALPIPIQFSLPDQMRARGTAIASLLMSGIAGTCGPFLVGLLIDRGGLSLSAALSTVCGVSGALAAALFAAARAALTKGPATARARRNETVLDPQAN